MKQTCGGHTQKNLSLVLATVPWCHYYLSQCSLFHVIWPKVGGASPETEPAKIRFSRIWILRTISVGIRICIQICCSIRVS